ncbi:MAG: glycoside hydrolase family 130 protein, partial [Candidatus Doudnabacteria bacterium]
DGWQIDSQPTLLPDPQNHPEELWGIEDPRITFVKELKKYVVVYTAFTRDGPGVALALTEDFRTFERHGIIMSPEDKDAALLPYRIGGNWALIHRPVSAPRAHMWISYSPDLIHWGSHKLMMDARKGAWWDANKIGLSPPPIETSQGWLVIYHGVRQSCGGCIYRLGLALFDLNKPEICLKRGNEWIFAPEEPYEQRGDVGNVVFPCGYTIGPDGDTLNIYYGAADTSIALATGSIKEMLGWLEQHSS